MPHHLETTMKRSLLIASFALAAAFAMTSPAAVSAQSPTLKANQISDQYALVTVHAQSATARKWLLGATPQQSAKFGVTSPLASNRLTVSETTVPLTVTVAKRLTAETGAFN